MPYPFDATLKEILSLRPEDCVPVFELPRSAPAQTLNVDLSTISAATDVMATARSEGGTTFNPLQYRNQML